jgi:polar amino acid transport system substrate-binding protein
MTSLKLRVACLLAAAALAAGACGSPQVTSAPSAAPSATPAPTSAVTATPAPTPTPTPAPTQLVVANPPVEQLLVAGELSICTDPAKPPQESLDSSGTAVGSDVEIATEIARRLGLKPVFVKAPALNIVATLTSKKCDVIVSAQVINYTTRKSVDMIQYYHAGQVFIVPTGNPNAIRTVYDLCGKAVAVHHVTAEYDLLMGRGVYNSAVGLKARCQAAGKKTIDVKTYPTDADALVDLASAKVAAFFTTTPVGGALVLAQPGQIQIVPGLVLGDTVEGISVGKKNTTLRDDVGAALQSMIKDGTYLAILKKWGDDWGAVSSIYP